MPTCARAVLMASAVRCDNEPNTSGPSEFCASPHSLSLEQFWSGWTLFVSRFDSFQIQTVFTRWVATAATNEAARAAKSMMYGLAGGPPSLCASRYRLGHQ